MKKILFLGIILTALVSVSASAQVADGNHFRHQREMRENHHGQLTHFERRRLRHDRFRYRTARRRALHDGFIGRNEHRHLAWMRKHDRREAYRFNHNRRRVI